MDRVAVRWIVAMLSNRVVEATVCGTSIRIGVTKGCPQGGILTNHPYYGVSMVYYGRGYLYAGLL